MDNMDDLVVLDFDLQDKEATYAAERPAASPPPP
jgi:hypothetical protein